MMSIIYRKSLPHALVILAGTLILMFGAAVAFAQTDLPEGVTQAQIEAALEDISALYGSPVVRTDQARAICNEEQYFLACAEIGTEHDLFDADRAEQVDTLVTELKGDVADRIAECSTVECLMDVATSIARDLSRSNPSVARAVELTSQNVEAKQAIVDAAKELGVDFEACRTMDPETASVDLLRACARLAKDTRVQQHIPEASRGRTDNADATIALKENLASGEVQCGNGTLEGCGDFCLNPSAEARAQGAAAIPQVCRDIAQRFFGPEGITHLEDAYTAVQDTFNNISQRQGSVFTTPDGQTLTNPAAIGRYLEAAGQRGDIAAITSGMDFMIANGFAKAADKDFVVKMVQKIQERGAINFDECRTNPEACRDFIPEDHQGEFVAMGQVEKIMRTAMANLGVTDPSRCEFDHSIGRACMDGARAALPQIRALAGQYPQLDAMIADLEQKIRFGEEAFTARSRAEEHMREGVFIIGGQRFNSMTDLETFCRTHSDECLAEAARTGVFSRDVAAEKYQYAAERRYEQYRLDEWFPGVYEPRPAYEDTGSLAPQFSQFDKEAARKAFEAWLDNPQGPAPYTGSGYQTMPYPYPGDTREGYYPPGRPYPYPYPGPACADVFPRPCPAGEYRQESRDPRGCFIFGSCIPFATKTQQKSIDGKVICPAMPTVESCPAGQEKIVSFSSPECGTYYMCETKYTTGTQVTYPYTFRSGKITPSYEAARMYCYESGSYGATARGDVGECGASFGFSVPPMPPEKQCSQYGNGWYPVDSSGNCFSPDKTQYRTPNGTLQQCSATPVYGCGTTTTSCPSEQYWDGDRCLTSDIFTPTTGQKQQIWNSFGLQSWIREDASATRIASLKTACANVKSSANVWTSGAGSQTSTDFGMPDPAKCAIAASCTGEQYFDGTSCVISSTGGGCSAYATENSCKATGGCRWDPYPPAGTPSCTSAGSTTTTCPSGQYWSGTSCVSNTMTTMSTASGMQKCFYPNATINGTYPGYTVWCEKDYYNCHVGDPSGAAVSLTGLTLGAPSTCESGWTGATNSCPSGQYWDGTKCGTAAEGCVRAGGTWDSATSYCKMPSSASSCGTYTSMSTCSANSACRWDPANYCASNTTTTTTCPSGQYWNGSSCVSNTTVTGSCSSELTGLLGTGCHNMGNAWFNGEMTQYVMPNTTVVNYCASSWVSGCSGSTTTGGCPSYTTQSTCTAVAGACSWNSTSNYCSYSNTSSCPSGQYWNGSSCVNNTTTTCASGQYWNGSACVTSTYSSDPQTACAQGGGTWNSSTSYCQMPNSTACPSGQYWNGSSCVNNTTTTCASGQYWNGTACVNTSSTDCPSGQYWNGSSCVTTDYSSAQSGCTSAGGTWDSTANYCNMPTSYFCPSGHGWDGSHCTFAQQPTQEKFTASVLSAFLSLLGIRW